MPIQSSPRRAVPCLPCLAEPNRSLPSPAITSRACLAMPNRAVPCHALPRLDEPSLPCHTEPSSATPRLTKTLRACRAQPHHTAPSQAVTNRYAPSLPRCSAYWILNLALMASMSSVFTTWNKPNPQPALALLSGLPAPIPTCKPQRLTRLTTSMVLN